MQEITPGIFIETVYSGATLGVINAPQGLILIDAPIKADDARLWKAAIFSLSSGMDRLLVSMDSHPDRTIGVRNMECTVAGHDNLVQVFKNRPNIFKTQNSDTGSDWEQISNLGTIRWNPPEISFSHHMTINWDNKILQLESHPGPNPSAIWLHIPQDKVLFIGDLVVFDQPPFLSKASLDEWIQQLALLESTDYKGYVLIGGRNGLVPAAKIHHQLTYLQEIKSWMQGVKKGVDLHAHIEKFIPELMKPFTHITHEKAHYEQRLRWGLTHLVGQAPRASTTDTIEE